MSAYVLLSFRAQEGADEAVSTNPLSPLPYITHVGNHLFTLSLQTFNPLPSASLDFVPAVSKDDEDADASQPAADKALIFFLFLSSSFSFCVSFHLSLSHLFFSLSQAAEGAEAEGRAQAEHWTGAVARGVRPLLRSTLSALPEVLIAGGDAVPGAHHGAPLSQRLWREAARDGHRLPSESSRRSVHTA